MSVRSRIHEGLREPVDDIADLWPKTAAQWAGTILVGPVILALALAILWVAGVLAISAVGSIVGSDLLDRTDDLATPAQGAIYIATSIAVLAVAWIAAVVAGAFNDERHARELHEASRKHLR